MTATFTATATFPLYESQTSGRTESFSFTGSEAAVAVKVEQWKLNLGEDPALMIEVLPTAEFEAQRRQERVLKVARQVTADEDAAELDAIRYSLESGTQYHKTYRGAPLPR